MTKKTCGESGFSFRSPYPDRRIDYTEGMGPRTDARGRHMLTLGINESFCGEDFQDIAGAIARVTPGPGKR